MRAVQGEAAGWSQDTYLLATAVDHLGVLASEMRWKKSPPLIERPGQPAPEQKPVSAVDVRAELEKRREAAQKKKRKK